MPQDYLQMFNRFFNKEGRMSSTYKPVFLRALLDMGDLYDSTKAKKLVGNQWIERKDDKLLVNLEFIAVRFAKYYWDMEYSFRLRQSQDPQDANITRLIKSFHEPGDKPPTIKDLSGKEMEQFRKKVVARSIKPEVLVHLLTDMVGFYKKIDSQRIEFDADIIEFLYTHKILLRKGINNVLSKYLEKLNRMTPRISNKIDSEQIKRTALNVEMQLRMNKWQKSRCFYCEYTFEKYHVDHVVPFNYVFSTDSYNCVLACQQCNCTKSDMLPTKKLFASAVTRNQEINDYLQQINARYNEKSYKSLFDACAEEYNGGKFFSPK